MKKKVVVLGAGMSGLATAYKLSRNEEFDVTVVDKASHVGGMCRSFTESGFTLDCGPHKFYSLVDGIVDELKDLMQEDLLEREKTQNLYMHGKYFSFPLQMTEMIKKFPLSNTSKILMSYAAQVAKRPFSKEPETYEEFIVQRFGRGLYEEIFMPMAKKIYGDPSRLDRRLAEVRISSPGLMSVVKQMLFKTSIDRSLSAPSFHYPREGFGAIPEKFKKSCQEKGVEFLLEHEITGLDVEGGRLSQVQVRDKAGMSRTLESDYVVYTIPPTLLPKLLSKMPFDLGEACQKVKFRHTVVYYYLLKSEPVLPAMWVFFPEPQFRFGRLSEMVKFSPDTAPKGHTSLMVDFTCESEDPVWQMDDRSLGQYLYGQMKPLKLFRPEQIEHQFARRFQNIYPVYEKGFQSSFDRIRDLEMDLGNLFFIGRLGDFSYNNSDQCMDMGFQVANYMKDHGDVSENWQGIRANRFDQYKIVD